LRGDDGWAFHLISALKRKAPPGVHLFWGESAPENFLLPISRLNPKSVLICDAGEIPGPPGSWGFFAPEELPEEPVFSHRFPLKLMSEELKRRSSALVKFLLLRPLNIEFSQSLSPKVKRSLSGIIPFLERALLEK